MKIVKINDIEYKMEASILTLANYQIVFGMDQDFAKDYIKANELLNQLNSCYVKENGKFKLIEGKEHDVLETSSNLVLIASRIAYILIYELDNQFMPYNKWVARMNGILDDMTWVKEVVGIASWLFHRQL